MYHLLLVCCVTAITFAIMNRRYRVEAAYWLLVALPTLVFLVAIADEFVRGIQQLNHQLLHVAYDSSYALSLIGIILILRAIFRRRLIILVVAGTCIAGIPLAYLFITQP